MKKIFFFIIFLFLVSSTSIYASKLTLTGTGKLLEDAYVAGGSPDTNYGDNIQQTNLINDGKSTIMKWNISSIPEGVTITKAYLNVTVYYNYLDAGEYMDIGIFHVYNPPSYSWSEFNITWNTRPTTSSEMNLTNTSSINFTNTGEFQCSACWYNWTITDMLNQEYQLNNNNLSIILQRIAGNGGPTDDIHLVEREGGSGYVKLEIEYLESSPTVVLNKPANYSNLFYKNKPFTFNFSVTDYFAIKNASLYGDFGSGWHLNQTNTTEVSNSGVIFNFDSINISRGNNYIWNVEVCDINNNCSFALSNFTFNISNSIPSTPILLNPSDTEVIPATSQNFNWTSSQDNDTEDIIIYYLWLDNNTNPTTLAWNGTENTTTITGLSDGQIYYWKVQASDGYVNSSNSSIRSFTVSADSPAINIINPLNNVWNTTNTTINITFTATDANNVDICELWINSTGIWHLNQTINATSAEISGFDITLIDEQEYIYNLWCNDSLGNGDWRDGNITFGIDTITPSLAVSSPIETTYNVETIDLTFTASDSFLDTCYYSLYYNDTRILKESNNSINCSATKTLQVPYYSGYYRLNVSVNDSAGNINSTSIIFLTETSSNGTTIINLGGGGGGVESSPLCNFSMLPQNLTFYKDETVIQIFIINDEEFSITPSYILNKDRYQVKGSPSFILGNGTSAMSLLRIHQDTVNASDDFKITFAECSNVLNKKILFVNSTKKLNTIEYLENLLSMLYNSVSGNVKIFGNNIPFYIFTLIIILATIISLRWLNISLRSKIFSGIFIIIFLNIILALTFQTNQSSEIQPLSLINSTINKTVESKNAMANVLNASSLSTEYGGNVITIKFWVFGIIFLLITFGILFLISSNHFWTNVILSLLLTKLFLVIYYYILNPNFNNIYIQPLFYSSIVSMLLIIIIFVYRGMNK